MAPAGVVAVVAFVVAFARDQQGPGVVTPGPRPAHTAGAVTADRWVDDLESEHTERRRGFESLRFGYPGAALTLDGMIVFRCPFWPVAAFLVAFGLLCLRLGHDWIRVRRARLDRLAGAAYQQRRGQNRARETDVAT